MNSFNSKIDELYKKSEIVTEAVSKNKQKTIGTLKTGNIEEPTRKTWSSQQLFKELEGFRPSKREEKAIYIACLKYLKKVIDGKNTPHAMNISKKTGKLIKEEHTEDDILDNPDAKDEFDSKEISNDFVQFLMTEYVFPSINTAFEAAMEDDELENFCPDEFCEERLIHFKEQVINALKVISE